MAQAEKMSIQHISRIIVSLLKVSRIVLSIVIGFELSGLIWYLVSSYSGFLQLDNIIHLESGMRVIMPFSFDVLSSRDGMTAFITTVVQQGLILAMLYIVTSIFNTIQESHSPFVPGIAKKMKVISILVLLANVSTPISSNFLHIPSSAELESLFSITDALGTFVIAGIFYCFAVVFEYGLKLQQESDQTL